MDWSVADFVVIGFALVGAVAVWVELLSRVLR